MPQSSRPILVQVLCCARQPIIEVLCCARQPIIEVVEHAEDEVDGHDRKVKMLLQ